MVRKRPRVEPTDDWQEILPLCWWPEQVEYVLGQLTLRRSKAALQLQLAKALMDLERHFGDPVRRPPSQRRASSASCGRCSTTR
jgi:hypothetical protein